MDMNIIVLDIGKTFAKMSLWGEDGELIEQASQACHSDRVGPIRAMDTETVESWMRSTLHRFAAEHPIGVIVPVAHGAAGAVIRGDALACPVFDYETPVPPEIREPYDAQRDPFHATGSPAQSLGLNLGVQFHWLEQLYPEAFGDDAQILTWPQFWAWRLSGVASTEVTSLACHTDLWLPEQQRPSTLAQTRGWAEKFAPLRKAGDILGKLRPDLSEGHPGLRETRVYCGIHDSNASLLGARGFDEFQNQDCTTLATGTWFVAMRSPGPDSEFRISDLPENRECLVNCDLQGDMVPTSIFMGGRELATVLGDAIEQLDVTKQQPPMLDALANVVDSCAMLLPTFTPGVGPFPNANGRWENEPADPVERNTAACLYAALVAEVQLTLLGSSGRVLVDGRFSNAHIFTRALAALRPDIAIYVSDAEIDIAHGALQLAGYATGQQRRLTRVEPLERDITPYAKVWRNNIA